MDNKLDYYYYYYYSIVISALSNNRARAKKARGFIYLMPLVQALDNKGSLKPTILGPIIAFYLLHIDILSQLSCPICIGVGDTYSLEA